MRLIRPGQRLGLEAPLAWLDRGGDLLVDRLEIERAAAAFRERLLAGDAQRLQDEQRRDAGRILPLAIETGRRAAELTETEARSRLHLLASAMVGIFDYGILAKFLPDVILGVLREQGYTGPVPLPTPSLGAGLARDLVRLARYCSDEGYPPERLLVDRPAPDDPVGQAIVAFSSGHVGHGPLPWDAPGYEDPDYVVGMMARAFGGLGKRELTGFRYGPHARSGESPGAPSANAGSLWRLLARWLDFLERETWLARRGFFLGMMPLLVRLGGSQTARDDLLFSTIDELTTGALDPVLLVERRQKYLADTAYLTRYGISSRGRSLMHGA